MLRAFATPWTFEQVECTSPCEAENAILIIFQHSHGSYALPDSELGDNDAKKTGATEFYLKEWRVQGNQVPEVEG